MALKQEQIQYLITYVHDKSGAQAVTKSNQRIGSSFSKLAMRAALVIPVWLALRTAFMAFINTIRSGLTYMKDLDKGLARAKAVMHGVADTGLALKELSGEVKSLGRSMGVSAQEATEAFYRMGTAGLNAEESLAGMRIALKTSIAMMGDTAQVARGLADIYNLMGDSMEGVTTPAEKMNKIGSTMALLWRSNAFEIGEFLSAIKTFLPTAKLVNLTLDETLGTLAVLHTLMRRSSSAGTEMSRTFIMLSNRLEQVESFLSQGGENVIIDRENINQFDLLIRVVTKLNLKLKEGKNIASDVADVFGIKGMKSTAALAGNLEKLTLQLKLLAETDINKRMEILNELFDIQMDTVERQLKIFGNLRDQTFQAFITGITGAENFLGAIKAINGYVENNLLPTLVLMGVVIGSAFKNFAAPLQAVLTILDSIEMKTGAFGMKHIGLTDDPEKLTKAINAMEKLKNLYVLSGDNEMIREAERILEGLKASKGIKTEEEKRRFIEQGLGVGSPEDKKEASYKEQLLLLEDLEVFGYTDLEIGEKKLQLMKDTNREYKDQEGQRLKNLEIAQKERIEFAKMLEETISGGIGDMLKGDIGIAEFGQRLAETLRNTFIEEFSKTITKGIFKATGIGDMFSKSMISIKRGFDYGSNLTYKAITSAFSASMRGVGGAGGTYPGGYAPPGYTDPNQGWIGSGKGNTSAGGNYPGGYAPPGYADPGKSGMTGSQKAGMGVAGGLMAFSQYQSVRTAGGSSGEAIGSAALMGIGGMLMMSGNPVGIIAGGIMMIVGSIIGQGAQGETYREDVKEQTNQIASRIDVSNSHLEWVNRNLVALRQELTYILPNSTYFGETNTADEFGISAQRGGQ